MKHIYFFWGITALLILNACSKNDEFIPTPPPIDSNSTVSNPDSKVGIWLWYIEQTGYTHQSLATKLAQIGVKRIYVKVADGSYNPASWPEVNDKTLVDTYKKAGLEVWAWSYNYPGKSTEQATALYQAAKAGFQGYVTDIEVEFDGNSSDLESIMKAFADAKQKAISDGVTTSTFKLACTSWGNPKDHNMRVDIIDKYVDAHMPQTYVVEWGTTYLSNLTYWVNYGTQEYKSLGCVKPVNHIVSVESGNITALQVNDFIKASGAETSIWRVPGGDVSMGVWNILSQVNWTNSTK